MELIRQFLFANKCRFLAEILVDQYNYPETRLILEDIRISCDLERFDLID